MKIVDKSRLVAAFDNALNRATSIVIKNAEPISRTRNSAFIGVTIVEKNSIGYYDVRAIDKTMLFENISVFDVALVIAQRYSAGDRNVIRQILTLEEKYSKHYSDMIHCLHCFKAAKKKNDIEKMCILEDKFQVAELLAKSTKDKITSFKRTKSDKY